MRPEEDLPRRRGFWDRGNAVRLQDAGDRRAADPMANVLQGAEDPRVAPGGILFRHPHNQPPHLREHARTTAAPLRVRPLARDQLPMPAENRVGRDNGRDRTQTATAEPLSTRRQPTAFLIRQPDPAVHVPAQNAVLLDQVDHGRLLPLVEPADQCGHEQAQGRRVEHGGSLNHRPDLRTPKTVGRAMRHYELEGESDPRCSLSR